jgi:hypothetical protein
MEAKVLEQIARDVSEVKQKIGLIEQELSEICEDLHEVKPEYLEKLKRIDGGKFLSREEFEKTLED